MYPCTWEARRSWENRAAVITALLTGRSLPYCSYVWVFWTTPSCQWFRLGQMLAFNYKFSWSEGEILTIFIEPAVVAWNLGVVLNFNKPLDCSASSSSTDESYSTNSSMYHILIIRGHWNIHKYGDYKRGQLLHFHRQITSSVCPDQFISGRFGKIPEFASTLYFWLFVQTMAGSLIRGGTWRFAPLLHTHPAFLMYILTPPSSSPSSS